MIQLTKNKVPFKQINAVIKAHKSQLQNLIRYERYMIDETPTDWAYLLGGDVIGLTHPKITAEITKRFILFQDKQTPACTEREKILLYTATLIHDFGELVLDNQGIGDVTFEEHTANDSHIEQRIFKHAIAILPDSPEKSLMQTAYQEIVMNKTSTLGEIFNVIERIGYLQTGLRAYTGTKGQRIKNWKGLTGNVLSNQITPLLQYATKYPYVTQLLQTLSKPITKAFEATIKGKVPNDKLAKPSYDLGKLQKNYDNWQSSPFIK